MPLVLIIVLFSHLSSIVLFLALCGENQREFSTMWTVNLLTNKLNNYSLNNVAH